jgi:hypothetical protein
MFRSCIASKLPSYRSAVRLFDKALIVESIARDIRQAGGRFLKYDHLTGTALHELTEHQIKEKVGRALRDAVATSEAGARAARRSSPGQLFATTTTAARDVHRLDEGESESLDHLQTHSLYTDYIASPLHHPADEPLSPGTVPRPAPSPVLASMRLVAMRGEKWRANDPDFHGAIGDTAESDDAHEQFLEAIDSVLGEEDHGEAQHHLGGDMEGVDPFMHPYS